MQKDHLVDVFAVDITTAWDSKGGDMAKRIKTTKGQRKELLNCHVGVGFMVFHSCPDKTTECEFYISRKTGKPHYIANGEEIRFELDRTEES